MFTFIDAAAFVSSVIFFKTYKTTKTAYISFKSRPPKKPRTTFTGYVSIETAIKNRDINKCKSLYLGHLASFDEKPDTLFLPFLFESLESRRIPITQELIDSIRYINSRF